MSCTIACVLVGNDSVWFWTCLQCLILLGTLVFIYRELKTQTASHVVQSIAIVNDRWNSDQMQRIRHEVCTQWKNGNKEFDGACEVIAEFMEDLGVIHGIKAIPTKVLWEVQSWNVEHYWVMFEPGINKLKAQLKDDTLYTNFKTLFEDMTKIDLNEGAPKKDDKDVAEFVDREIRSTGIHLKYPRSA